MTGGLLRRSIDAAAAAAGLLLLLPVGAAVALLILLREGRPVLFSQTRVGRFGRPFRIWKFRTMHAGCAGSAITAAGDRRVTATGAWLRKYKIDELPQLFNVLTGDMSLVGPRPESPRYVNPESPAWQAVLRVRPGITDPATLLFRHEEALLGRAADAEWFYRWMLLPAKLRLNVEYLNTRSLSRDLALIWLTIASSLRPSRFDPARIERAFGTKPYGYIHSVSSAVDR